MVSTARVRWVLVLLAGTALAGCHVLSPQPPAAPTLLLLITVDTLRADRLGAYGSDLGLTPRLDALAAESLVFTAAYAPASFTVPSVSALMSGRYPQELGIRTNESGLPAVPTLASTLRARGWRTSAVVSNFVLRRRSGLAAGFDTYDDAYPELEPTRRWPERTAPHTTEAALAALDACAPGPESRCLLWVHYQDPHGPYTPPEVLRRRYAARERDVPDGTRRLPTVDGHGGLGGIPRYQRIGDEREVAFYRGGYDGEVRFMDEHVGRLLDGVRARGLDARALIVVAADHGEGLGEDDYWFAHGELLTDPLVRVPLLLRIPGGPTGPRDDVVSLVDVLPTVLRLLVGTPPSRTRSGRDLLAPGAEARPSRPYLANLGAGLVPRAGLVEGPYVYLIDKRAGGWEGRLLRRGTGGADAGGEAPEVRARLHRELVAFQERPGQAVEETRQSASAADRERLRALGYVGEADD